MGGVDGIFWKSSGNAASAMQLILLHLSGQQLSKVRLRLRCVKWKWRPRKKCQSRRQLWIQLNHSSQQIMKVSRRTFSVPQFFNSFYDILGLLRKFRPRPNFQFQLIVALDRKSPPKWFYLKINIEFSRNICLIFFEKYIFYVFENGVVVFIQAWLYCKV